MFVHTVLRHYYMSRLAARKSFCLSRAACTRRVTRRTALDVRLVRGKRSMYCGTRLSGWCLCQTVGPMSYGSVMNAGVPASGPGRRTGRDEAAELVTRLPLFLSSYLPLFVILAIRFDQPEWLWRVCAGLVAAGLLSVAAVLWAVRQGPVTSVRVDSVRDAGAEAGGYLATYVLPFVVVAMPSARDMVGFAIFLFVLAIIYVRSDPLQVNPAIY